MCFQNRFSRSDHQWKYGTKEIKGKTKVKNPKKCDEDTDDDEADDGEDTDDDEAGDDEAADNDEADDDETAGGDGDKTDEEESGGREGDGADEGEIRRKSAVYLHLLSRPDCLSVYDDSHFSVLCRARYVQQLKVLEAVCIRTHKPDLCKQNEHVLALRLFS